MLKKYVLAGGPCSGKTEVLQALQKRGFYCLNEVARYLIHQERNKSGNENFKPSEDIVMFQKKLLATQTEWERDVPSNIEKLFSDRGVIDGIAFLNVNNKEIFPGLLEAAKKANYSKIFYLDMLKNYSKDEFRQESEEEARRIHQIIGEVYKSHDYDLIRIPEMGVEERVEMILKEIKNDDYSI